MHRKGIILSYGKAVYSVANYVAKYPPIPNPKKRVPKTEKLLEKIAEDITCKSVNKYTEPNFLIKLLFPILMPKHIEHLHELDRYFYITEECISCGMCSKVCPCNNIEMKDSMPIFKHKCSQCMAHISSRDISLDKKYIE